MENNNLFLSQPYDTALQTAIKEGSSKLVAPLVNAMFYPEIHVDEYASIQHLPDELIMPYGWKEKISDSQFLMNNEFYYIACDCNGGAQVIDQIIKHSLNAALNLAEERAKREGLKLPYEITIPYTGVLCLRNPPKDQPIVRIETVEGQLEYHIHTLVINDYSLEDLCNANLYILVPYYLFNHERDIGKYLTDSTSRRVINKVMHEVTDVINTAYSKDKIQIPDYRVLKVLLKTVTDGLIKDMGVELNEVMDEGLFRIQEDNMI